MKASRLIKKLQEITKEIGKDVDVNFESDRDGQLVFYKPEDFTIGETENNKCCIAIQLIEVEEMSFTEKK